MAKGIVVKVWNVKAGSSTRSAAAQISDSIDYIENPEKTGVPLNIANANQLGNELTYVTNEIKTVAGLYVGCRHISDISHATDEMMQIKEFYGKLDGRVATHGIISLDASESDPKNAAKLMELLNELMESIFPKHQVVYAVHTNTENLHIHFIINTVGLDGKKIHMDKSFMRQVMEVELNKLAEKYGFTPNETWKKEKVKDPIPFPQRKIMLRELVDIAIEQTDEFDAFVAYLRNEGLTVNVGRNITLQTEEMPFALRSGQLGENYSISAIKKRLDSKYDPFKPVVAGDYYSAVMPQEMANIVPKKMKAYKDMTKEEKLEAVHLENLDLIIEHHIVDEEAKKDLLLLKERIVYFADEDHFCKPDKELEPDKAKSVQILPAGFIPQIPMYQQVGAPLIGNMYFTLQCLNENREVVDEAYFATANMPQAMEDYRNKEAYIKRFGLIQDGRFVPLLSSEGGSEHEE